MNESTTSHKNHILLTSPPSPLKRGVVYGYSQHIVYSDDPILSLTGSQVVFFDDKNGTFSNV